MKKKTKRKVYRAVDIIRFVYPIFAILFSILSLAVGKTIGLSGTKPPIWYAILAVIMAVYTVFVMIIFANRHFF